MIKRGFSSAVGSGLARLGVFLKSFEKELILMNLCNVNGKVPDLKRHHPLPKVDKQHDQLQYTLSNTRMCLFLLGFCDQSWGFGIKASYFFRAFSSKKVVTVSQQECFGLERTGISPIID